ncbi:hypothetical protein VaNZ11_006797 [Volvox africanus]|uniref:Elongator complex protein 2 n=1 Tax=Volvox africanus TaxID=51714 RepID=A0ABQ5S2R7_9CHLO|nr:hypothetical protein VaNZ11_006797 [Volvox africanus]
MMEVSLDYIGVGVNRVVNALAWSEDGGVAYAAHHMIALYDIKSAKVLSTICGHTGMVNCVHWVPREATPELPPSQQLLLSGAADNTVCCWLVTNPDLEAAATTTPSPPPTYTATQPSWRRLAVLQGHTAPVTSVAVRRLPAGHTAARGSGSGAATATEPRLLLVSTAGDADVIVWACNNEDDHAPGFPDCATDSAVSIEDDVPKKKEKVTATAQKAAADAWYGQARWQLSQRIHVGTKIQTTAAITQLPLDPEWTLLATGGTDRKVHLYVRPPASAIDSVTTGGGRFTSACVLEGHENWIRGVAFCCVEGPAAAAGPQLLLASVSQDRYGRIWKLQPEPLHRAAAAAAVVPVEQENPLTALIQRYAPKPHVVTTKTRYVATCEALLIGHEDWVHGLQWAPPPSPSPLASAWVTPSPPPPPTSAAPPPPTSATSSCSPEARVGGAPATAAAAIGEGAGVGRQRIHTRATAALLTTSMDRTVIIWRFEADSGLWMNEASLGDAGASCLGYFGGVWGAGGSSILAHGFTGALHLWSQPPEAATTCAASRGLWLPYHALGGHFGAVVDLGWGLDGGCLISVSEDQTARVHTGVAGNRRGRVQGGREGGEEQREEEDATAGRAAGGQQQEQQLRQQHQLHWCEVARAQVHGHDFRCVAPVATPPGGPYVYVSGSEEKVLRVLEAPQAFIDTLVALRGGEGSPGGRAIRAEGRRGHGFGAAVAALGLSNKAVDVSGAAEGGANAGVGSGMPGGDYTDGPDFVPCAAPQVVREPPLEEHLAQNTLWPETYKLYGHGNDVFCTAASPDGRYLASACKAQTAATAAIWVWCTRTWRALAQLRAHTLTVTQLEWSPSGSLLVAASRDRTFSVFRRRHDDAAVKTPAAAAAPGGVTAATADAPSSFDLLCRVKNAHGRLIWSVSWSLDEQLIATASRDDTVKVWRMGGAVGGGGCGGGDEGSRAAAPPSLALTLPQFSCAATATAFAPRLPASSPVSTSSCSSVTVKLQYVLAVGLENGSVQVWHLVATVGDSVAAQGPSDMLVASCLWTACDPWRHVAAVRRLRWRGAPGTATAVPEGDESKTVGSATAGVEGDGMLQLASGSDDHSVRVFTLRGI